MKTYARWDYPWNSNTAIVVEFMLPAVYDAEDPSWQPGEPSRIGQEIPIELRFHPDLVARMVDITDMDPKPDYGWTWDGQNFHAPVPYVPSPAEIEAQRESYRQQLKNDAAIAMTPILVSLNLGDATDEETVKAKAWQSYYRDLTALQISGEGDEPDWPSPPAI